MGYWPALSLFDKNSLHSKLELPSHKSFQLPIPSSGIFYPPPHSPKNLFKLSSTGDKIMSLSKYLNLSIKVNSSLQEYQVSRFFWIIFEVKLLMSPQTRQNMIGQYFLKHYNENKNKSFSFRLRNQQVYLVFWTKFSS